MAEEKKLKQQSLFECNTYNSLVILDTENGQIVRRASQHQLDTVLKNSNCEQIVIRNASELTEEELFLLGITKSFNDIPIYK